MTLQEQDFKTAVRRVSEEELDEMNLNYYNYEVHQASFVLPQFAAKVVFLCSKTSHKLWSLRNYYNKC